MPARLFLVVLFLLVSGCRKTQVTDDRPIEDQKILLDEMKRVQKGEVVGERLRLPKIDVDATQITVNGHRVAGRRDLDTSGKLRRIEPVFDWLKGMREHWKTIHPSETFSAKVLLTLPEDVAFNDGASLLTTIAYAGYPNDVTIQAGAFSATLDLGIPMPPTLEDMEKTNYPMTFSLCKANSAWQAFASPAPPPKPPNAVDLWGAGDPGAPTAPWGRDPVTVAADQDVVRGVGWEPVTDATSESVAQKLCTASGCTFFTVGASGPTTLKEALAMVAPAFKARRSNPPFGSGVRFSECSLDPPAIQNPPDVKGRPARAPTLRPGAIQVNGRLPPEVIQRIVRQNFGRFRLCYENALRTNPNLQGRVAVKFIIGRGGEVTTAQDGGSDISDPSMVSCVVKGFGNLSFPQPEGGIVTVVYPMMFAPAE